MRVWIRIGIWHLALAQLNEQQAQQNAERLREYIEAKIGIGKSVTKQKLCVLCLMQGQRVVMG